MTSLTGENHAEADLRTLEYFAWCYADCVSGEVGEVVQVLPLSADMQPVDKDRGSTAQGGVAGATDRGANANKHGPAKDAAGVSRPDNFLAALAGGVEAFQQEIQQRANTNAKDVSPNGIRLARNIVRSAPAAEFAQSNEAISQMEAVAVSRHISAVKASESSGSDMLVVYGPIQASEGNLVNILGQEFDIADLGIATTDLTMFVGRSAYIEAESAPDGYSATRLEVYDEFAVPGATSVYVQGSLNEVSSDVGRVHIAGLEIDVTNVPSGSSLETGTSFAIPGIQPIPGGLILGQELPMMDANLVAALSTSKVASISGSSGRSISGSSGRSISGSSGRSISGSSGRSISGSSGRSISGSSGRSISGSSGRSISGSSGRSISGSSGRSISGSSGRSISGSSGRSISGSSGR